MPGSSGRRCQISRLPVPLPIVGVMPAGRAVSAGSGRVGRAQLRRQCARSISGSSAGSTSRNPRSRGWNVVARLRPGVTAAAATTEIASIATAVARNDSALEGLTATARPVLDVHERGRRRLLCRSSARWGWCSSSRARTWPDLLLARGLQRQSEYALRSALGATWRRLVGQALTESVALAFLGACVGGVVAVGLVVLFTANRRPRAATRGRGVRGLARLCVLRGCGVAGRVVSGLLPAARAGCAAGFTGSRDAQHGQPRRAATRERRGRSADRVDGRLALRRGAPVRTARNLAQCASRLRDREYSGPHCDAMQGDRWKDFHTRALERVAAIPGVRHAAFAWGLPLTGNNWPGDIEVIGASTSDRLAERLTAAASRGDARLLLGHGHRARGGPSISDDRRRRDAARGDRQPIVRPASPWRIQCAWPGDSTVRQRQGSRSRSSASSPTCVRMI